MADSKIDPSAFSDTDFQILNEAMQRLFGLVEPDSDFLTDEEWARARELMQAFEREAVIRDARRFGARDDSSTLTAAERRALAEGLVEHADGGYEAFDWEAENFDPDVIRSCVDKGVLEETGYKGLVRGTNKGKEVFYNVGVAVENSKPSPGIKTS